MYPWRARRGRDRVPDLPSRYRRHGTATRAGAGTPLPGGTETLLVVEDDEGVRDLVREVLAPLGYQVLVTASGEDAIRASDATRGPSNCC